MNDTDQVAAAFRTYIGALNSLDMANIEPLWLRDKTVTQVEPNSEEIFVGWSAVRKKSRSLFGHFAETNIGVAAGPFVQVVGWTTSVTPAIAKIKTGEVVNLRVCTTQVFERHDDAWLVRSNIALPVPQ